MDEQRDTFPVNQGKKFPALNRYCLWLAQVSNELDRVWVSLAAKPTFGDGMRYEMGGEGLGVKHAYHGFQPSGGFPRKFISDDVAFPREISPLEVWELVQGDGACVINHFIEFGAMKPAGTIPYPYNRLVIPLDLDGVGGPFSKVLSDGGDA